MSEHLTNIVVVALLYRDDKIFVAKRADTKETWPGRFELVGGHVDPGESIEQALRREVSEEIGVDINIECIIGAFTYESEDKFKVEIGYLCSLENGIEPTINPADHSEGRWIDRSEISVMQKDDEEVALVKEAFTIIEGKKEK